jgi:DhnA family fructose-bisphosphate aldolase class Ia
MTFLAANILHPSLFHKISEIRIADPDRVFQIAKKRKRRTQLTNDGSLLLIAADHPARRVTRVGTDELGMANRYDFLARIFRTLLSEQVDGVMASMDVLEELLLLHDLATTPDGRGFLDQKLLIASLNRGGLDGTTWELDDPVTGATPRSCKDWGMDGAKFLLRICDDEHSSLVTIKAASHAITELNALHLPTFLEPLPVRKSKRGYKVIKTAEALAKIVGVAAALGDSSRFLWLKLPYCDNFSVVAQATTLPILLLGGEPAATSKRFLSEVEEGLKAGSNVRGALVGRNVLYPGPEDPFTVAETVGGLIHKKSSIKETMEVTEKHAAPRYPQQLGSRNALSQ